MERSRSIGWGVLLLALGLGAARPAAAQGPPTVEYYHLDAVGSVRAVTSATGSVVRRHDYQPFGGEVPVEPLTGDTVRFAGKPRDPETRLDYFGARYYAERTARFTTVDPVMNIDAALVDPQRWNRYAYALNNPIKFTDPDGRNPLLLWLGQVAQRAASRPAVQRAQQAIANQGSRAWVALTRLLNAPAGQEMIKATTEMATGADLGPSGPGLNVSAAARSFGFTDFAEAGSLVGGRLANGGTAAVSFARIGDSLSINVSVVSGPAGTLKLIETGALDAARAVGASSARILASNVSTATARFLRRNGFVQQVQGGVSTLVKEVDVVK